MKKIIPCFFLLFVVASCNSKKDSIIDNQKLVNKQLKVMSDSLQRVSDSADHERMRSEVQVLHLRFDSLSKELKKFE